MSANTIHHRLRSGLDAERALDPVPMPLGRAPKLIEAHGKAQGYAEWSAELGLTEAALRSRLAKGMSPDEAMQPAPQYRHPHPEAWPGARDLSWDEDERARDEVEKHGSMSHAMVGERMGLSRARVQQIEVEAGRKLLKTREGRELLQMLRDLDKERSERMRVWPGMYMADGESEAAE